jgi:hypothetical protein
VRRMSPMLTSEMPHFHAFGCRHPGGMKAAQKII